MPFEEEKVVVRMDTVRDWTLIPFVLLVGFVETLWILDHVRDIVPLGALSLLSNSCMFFCQTHRIQQPANVSQIQIPFGAQLRHIVMSDTKHVCSNLV